MIDDFKTQPESALLPCLNVPHEIDPLPNAEVRRLVGMFTPFVVSSTT